MSDIETAALSLIIDWRVALVRACRDYLIEGHSQDEIPNAVALNLGPFVGLRDQLANVDIGDCIQQAVEDLKIRRELDPERERHFQIQARRQIYKRAMDTGDLTAAIKALDGLLGLTGVSNGRRTKNIGMARSVQRTQTAKKTDEMSDAEWVDHCRRNGISIPPELEQRIQQGQEVPRVMTVEQNRVADLMAAELENDLKASSESPAPELVTEDQEESE